MKSGRSVSFSRLTKSIIYKYKKGGNYPTL